MRQPTMIDSEPAIEVQIPTHLPKLAESCSPPTQPLRYRDEGNWRTGNDSDFAELRDDLPCLDLHQPLLPIISNKRQMHMPWKVRSSVFGSNSERSLYTALTSRWSERFNIYPNLPILNIIDIDRAGLPRFDFEVLKKSSVDYTLCSLKDEPILSVEFDGIGHGFSRDGKYIPIVYDLSDPYREEKMNRKLEVAHKAGYPFVIVSYPEREIVDMNLQLTLVDGIIGQVLTRKRTDELLKERIKELGEVDEAPLGDWDPLGDIVTGTEVEAEIEENPLARESWSAQTEASLRGLYKSWKEESFFDPPAPEIVSWPPDVNTLKQRIKAMRDAAWVGMRVTSDSPVTGTVSTTTKVRNISALGVCSLLLVEDLARLVHSKKLLNSRLD